jgi:Icc-related predicted phosphoesterase
MKIVATSDTHGNLPEIPECDVFIHAGDWTPTIDHSRSFQKDWFAHEFLGWTNQWVSRSAQAFYVAGNHDFVARTDPKIMDTPSAFAVYLENSSVEFEGVKFWGSPYSIEFGNWAFMKGESELRKIWDTIPDDTNVVIVHGPPYGYGDKCMYYDGRDPHQGSKSLTTRLAELVNLKLVICGHIHEDSGVFTSGVKPSYQIANVSYVDLNYRPRGYFYEFEI